MAKRLSSLFSSKDTDVPRSSGANYLDDNLSPPQTPPRGKLSKPMTKSPSDLHLNTRLNSDLVLPPVFTETGISSRPGSRDGRTPTRTESPGSRQGSSSRPQTPVMLEVPGTASPRDVSPSSAKLKRKSWLPGKSERQSTGPELVQVLEQPSSPAWIAGLKEKIPYDITKLLNGEAVDDLWDSNGDVLVNLYPKSAMRNPSFRVNSQLFADSRVLSYLAHHVGTNGYPHTPAVDLGPLAPLSALSIHDQYGETTQQTPGVPISPGTYKQIYGIEEQQVKSVHIPLHLEGDYSVPGTTPRGDDLELIVLYRNFFAFLCGGALIATQRQNSLFTIFMGISSILRRLQYGNDKGSSWGTIPWASFSRYTDELRLADVRSSREKNIEAIALGVAMKSWPLYAEGFSHAAGRLDDIKSIKSPKFDKIDPAIVTKLERASYELKNLRLIPLHERLDNFYFPSMFSGIANSQTATESKLVRFKEWKNYFMDFRQYTMTAYKKRYGNWPPKAKSKKNNFEESGLNRLLIKEVYQDFTDLYEMLADRTSLTPRSSDMPTIADDAASGTSETYQHALRSIESEYDRSTPPVAPPIPFDVPLIPAFRKQMLAKDAQNAKKLKDSELSEIMMASYNRESILPTTWLQEFIEYERRLCHGKTIQDLADIRCGQWLFMYAVLQTLPMTAVDARELKFTDGVEYFLCEAPKGGRPWMQDDSSTSRAWFKIPSGGGLVSMSADTIDHSVEGIYRRSYCWLIANKWAEALGPVSAIPSMPSTAYPPPLDTSTSPLLAPKIRSATASPFGSPVLQPMTPSLALPFEGPALGMARVATQVPANMGLQEVAPPAQSTRPVSNYNPNITFDNILASQQIQQKKGKKGKK